MKVKSRKRQLEPLTPSERKLVEDNLSVAKFAAWSAMTHTRGYTGSLSMEDLVGVAYYALCVASRDFEPEKGFLFRTYASRKAQGYIQHALRDHSRLVRIPRSVFKERSNVRDLMAKGLGVEEIASQLKIPMSRVVECENSWREIHSSLDHPPGTNPDDEQGCPLSNKIMSPPEDAETAIKKGILQELSKLPESTVDLLNRFYYDGSADMQEWELRFCENFFILYKGKLKENGWN